MENNLYRIEVIAHDNLPKIDTVGMLLANDGFAYVKLHPVKLTAKPKKHGNWIIRTENNICDMTYQYECSQCAQPSRCRYKTKFCPNCGIPMDGDNNE